MTYFGFLGRFLVLPIIILLIVAWVDRRRGRQMPTALSAWSPVWAIALHVIIALLYTTLWDNYLVATNVWWYDPALVSGIIFGWVPLEEYTFFVLQPIMTGLWLLFLARRLRPSEVALKPKLRLWSVVPLAVLWLGMAAILIGNWRPGTYLALELVWALPPIALQLAFGADILWRHRGLVLGTIIPATIYLSAADALAIGFGTWTIDPAQSLNIFLGVLPIEEFVFFLLTNTLVTFGVTLVLAKVSHERIAELRARVSARSFARPDVS